MNLRSIALGLALLGAPAAYAEQPDESDMQEQLDALRAELDEAQQELKELRAEPVTASAEHAPGFGHDVVVEAGETVQDAVSFGGTVRVRGTITGDAVSFGGSVVVEPTGSVQGDAVAFGGEIMVHGGGTVGGDRVAMKMPGVSMGEPVEMHEAGLGYSHVAADAVDVLETIYRRFVLMLCIAGAGVLAIGLFPNRVARVAGDLVEQPVRATVVGMLASFLLPAFAGLFALLTIGVGLPVSLVVMAFLGLAWLLGFVGFCQAVGDQLPFEQQPHGRWLAFLVGVFLLTFFGSLPWIGWLVIGVASMVGIGAAISTRLGAAA